MSAVQVSVVIPAYNASPWIQKTVTQILAHFERRNISGEVIVVDDGSEDDTGRFSPRIDNVRVIVFDQNRGKGAALREGFRRSIGEVVLFTDADLPYGVEPIDLARFYILERKFHAVVGDRSQPLSSFDFKVPILRQILSGFCSFFVRTILVGGVADTQCGFKAFRGDVARELAKMTRIDRFATDIEILYLLLKYNLDIKQIPVTPKQNDTSSVRLMRDSWIAALDIFRLRILWSLGKYRSHLFPRVYRDSYDQDLKKASS